MPFNAAYFSQRKICPICSNGNSAEIYNAPMDRGAVRNFIHSHYLHQGQVEWNYLAGTDFTLLECLECKLIYQQNVPNNELLDRLYNHWIDPQRLAHLETSRLNLDNFHRIAGELDVLFKMVGKPPSEITLLDYGFGHGRWARVARAMGAKVYATEIGDEKKRMGASLGVEVISDTDVDAMRFDVIHTEQVFEHLVNPADDFSRLAKATGCIFKIAVPHHTKLKETISARGLPDTSPLVRVLQGHRLSSLDNTYTAILPLEHLNIYSETAIEYLAGRNGMTIDSRRRLTTTTIDTTSLRDLFGSARRTAMAAAKQLLPPRGGYHVLRQARST